MNASLWTADRQTYVKVLLVACVCSLGVLALAASLAAREVMMRSVAGYQGPGGWAAVDRAVVRNSSYARNAERLTIVSLNVSSM